MPPDRRAFWRAGAMGLTSVLSGMFFEHRARNATIRTSFVRKAHSILIRRLTGSSPHILELIDGE
jgi:hypothetical protein